MCYIYIIAPTFNDINYEKDRGIIFLRVLLTSAPGALVKETKKKIFILKT